METPIFELIFSASCWDLNFVNPQGNTNTIYNIILDLDQIKKRTITTITDNKLNNQFITRKLHIIEGCVYQIEI